MKKFSKITNQKVSVEKKVEDKYTERDLLKIKLQSLMDSILTVQMYGPVTRYHIAGTMKVKGKEMLSEAILDFLEELTTNKKINLLESLKNEITDWKVLDHKLENLEEELKLNNKEIFNYKLNIKSLFERYKDDPEILFEKINESIETSDKYILEKKLNAVKKLFTETNNDVYKKIYNLYNNKLNNL
jgi:hypothetical protein